MSTVQQQQPAAAQQEKKKPSPDVPHVLSHWVKDENGMSRCSVLTKRRALGKGGFAVVYEMHRSEDGRPFACKVSSPRSVLLIHFLLLIYQKIHVCLLFHVYVNVRVWI